MALLHVLVVEVRRLGPARTTRLSEWSRYAFLVSSSATWWRHKPSLTGLTETRRVPTTKNTDETFHPSVRDRLARLAPDQRAAATAPSGPTLCIAPAGSGKTTTLVARAAWLIATGTPAGAIRAITFNKRAAVEMTERLDAAVAPLGVIQVQWIFTQTPRDVTGIYLRKMKFPFGL